MSMSLDLPFPEANENLGRKEANLPFMLSIWSAIRDFIAMPAYDSLNLASATLSCIIAFRSANVADSLLTPPFFPPLSARCTWPPLLLPARCTWARCTWARCTWLEATLLVCCTWPAVHFEPHRWTWPPLFCAQPQDAATFDPPSIRSRRSFADAWFVAPNVHSVAMTSIVKGILHCRVILGSPFSKDTFA